jgi:type II secretory pathway predicted ATPase ExeA
MKDNLVEFLKENPKTLIIDEVDKLFQANSIKKVEVLRDIQEETSEFGNTLILAGAPFIRDLMKRRTLRENYGQVDSRMDYIYETQGLSEKEIGGILEGFKMDKAAHKHITSLVIKTTRGGIRWLSKILTRCADIAGEGSITLEVVMEACSMMM